MLEFFSRVFCFGFSLLQGKASAEEPPGLCLEDIPRREGLFSFSCPTHFSSHIFSPERKIDQKMTVPIL